MCGCESWTIKKAECWGIDAFELWCWRRLLRVPWTARRSHQSILKEINPEYSLERLMLKLTVQYFSHLLRTADSLEKTLMLGKTEGRRRGWQKMRWLDGITDSMNITWANSRRWWGAGKPCMLQSMGSQRVGPTWWLNNSFFTFSSMIGYYKIFSIFSYCAILYVFCQDILSPEYKWRITLCTWPSCQGQV